MARILPLIAGVSAMCLAGAVTAAEPSVALTPKSAVKLISMKSNVLENTVEISFILEGSSTACGSGFEASNVRQVAAIQPVRTGSSQRREVVFHTFFWSEELGWFTWQRNEERAGEAMYIWSELKGEIRNK